MSQLIPSVAGGHGGAPSPFEFDGERIGVVLVDGEPWFVGSDLARILEYGDATHALRSVRDRNKGLHKMEPPSGLQEKLCVNEPGLYQLIMRSRSERAEAFQDWVTDEVLPRIRKTGGYSTPAAPTLPADYASALRALADTVERAEIEQRRAELAESDNRTLEARVEIAAPKVEVYDALYSTEGFQPFDAFAKTGGIPGPVTLRNWLQEKGIIRLDGLPRQEYVTRKRWFVVRGVRDLYVTHRGQIAILQLWRHGRTDET